MQREQFKELLLIVHPLADKKEKKSTDNCSERISPCFADNHHSKHAMYSAELFDGLIPGLRCCRTHCCENSKFSCLFFLKKKVLQSNQQQPFSLLAFDSQRCDFTPYPVALSRRKAWKSSSAHSGGGISTSDCLRVAETQPSLCDEKNYGRRKKTPLFRFACHTIEQNTLRGQHFVCGNAGPAIQRVIRCCCYHQRGNRFAEISIPLSLGSVRLSRGVLFLATMPSFEKTLIYVYSSALCPLFAASSIQTAGVRRLDPEAAACAVVGAEPARKPFEAVPHSYRVSPIR